jgi:hypothetical protein
MSRRTELFRMLRDRRLVVAVALHPVVRLIALERGW